MSQNATGSAGVYLYLFFAGISRALQSGRPGSGEFERIYRRLHHVLHTLRGDAPSHYCTGTKDPGRALSVNETPDHKACSDGGVVVLALFYLFYMLRLDSQTQDILHQLNRLLAGKDTIYDPD